MVATESVSRSSDAAAVGRDFDRVAKTYLRTRTANAGFRAQQRLILENIGRQCGRVLDVGCGPGFMLDELDSRAGQIVGMDLSFEMLRCARHRNAQRFASRLVMGDALALPFSDASFDLVVSMGTLEYVSRPGRMLSELRRVLAPDGTLAITYPHGDCLARNAGERLRSLYRRLRPRDGKRDGDFVVWRHRQEHFDELLAAAGLTKTSGVCCGVRVMPWPLSDLLPGLHMACNMHLERWRWLARRATFGSVYVVLARRPG